MTREERIAELSRAIELAKRARDDARRVYVDAADAYDDAGVMRRKYLRGES